jgi:vancomycin resistance protein YoaR
MTDPQTSAPPAGVKRPRGRRRLPLHLIVLPIVAILFAIPLILFVGYEFVFRDRVILGVSVLGQPINGLERAQVKQFLQNRFGNPEAILTRYGGDAITIRDDTRTWRAYPWELGLRTDFSPVAESSILLGHRGNWIQAVIEQGRCLWFGCDLGSDAQFDEAAARAYLGWLAPQVDRPARDASLRIEGIHVVATQAQNGRAIDGPVMLDRMRRRILASEEGDIIVALRETTPVIADANIAAAKAQAEAILAAPTLLTFNGRTWALDQAALAGLLSVRPQRDSSGKITWIVSIDQVRLTSYFKTLAREINQAARDARFSFDLNSRALSPIVSSQYGQLLDPEAAAKQVEQQLFAFATQTPGTTSALESLTARTIAIPVTVTKPTIAMEDTGKFGIKELVAQGVSNFKGSAAGRIQNIRTATAQFDGIVIAPGSTFSFDQYLGEVVEANGYDDAYVIFADRTVLGPGGGVCQVSSTVFRAAFFGGMPIVERWAHAYRVGYYEPPVGLDATVFAPTVDLKFTNDTGSYLLVQPKIDLRNTILTFNFYGTKPNRTVEMEEPIMERIIPHAAAIYTDDATLKKGTTKQIDFAHDGADVTVWRKITVNGQVKRDKFFSRYDPWVARYLVGTKVMK